MCLVKSNIIFLQKNTTSKRLQRFPTDEALPKETHDLRDIKSCHDVNLMTLILNFWKDKKLQVGYRKINSLKGTIW